MAIEYPQHLLDALGRSFAAAVVEQLLADAGEPEPDTEEEPTVQALVMATGPEGAAS